MAAKHGCSTAKGPGWNWIHLHPNAFDGGNIDQGAPDGQIVVQRGID